MKLRKEVILQETMLMQHKEEILLLEIPEMWLNVKLVDQKVVLQEAEIHQVTEVEILETEVKIPQEDNS